MTFSGLPSVRDPKQSLKSSSSASSSSSTSSNGSSSPSSSPVKSPLTTLRNVDPTASSQLNTAHGAPAVVATQGMMNRQSVEKSFEELVPSFMDRPIGQLGMSQINNSFLPTPAPAFQELQIQHQVPAPAPTATKKKVSPTNSLDPTQHAAYRKRLNVNQVCDWCRYRKIRCDRESPCNSCIHSKRECIRSPPSALIGNTPDEPASTKKAKRNRAEDKDGRRSKSYRGSSSSSQRSSSYNSCSSPGTDDEGSETSAHSSLSPVVGSLTLAGLGLGLLSTRRNSNLSLSTSSVALGNALQDQEHIDRVRRIEMVLCNVIPGAAEFIANGTQPPVINSSDTKGDRPLSLTTQDLEHSTAFKDLLSPQERFANISLNSPSVATSSKPSWLPTSLPTLQEEGSSESTPQQPSAFDHIERMKRIELLLSSISDMPLAKALLNQSQAPAQGDQKKIDDKKGSKKESKKSSKGDAKKNNNGNVVKRPHVAAGFAGQKPPPKLPQAIAEAANKKQAIRKKRVSAAAAARAAAKAAAAGTLGTKADQGLMGSSPGTMASPANSETFSAANTFASLEIPSLDVQTIPFSQQDHHQGMFSQQQHQLQMNQHHGSSPFPANPPFIQSHTYQLTVANVNSMTIPLPDTISSYGSLVVPASSSTCSSSQPSPTLAQAEAIGQRQDRYQEDIISTDGASPVNEMMYPQQDHLQMPYGTQSTSQYQQQQHNAVKSVNNASEYDMGFDLMSQVLTNAPQQSILGIEAQIHPFAQDASAPQQQHRQSIQIGEGGFTGFGLDMNESLESLMKKNMGSLNGLVSNLPNDAHSIQHPQASHPNPPSQLHESVSTSSSMPVLQSTPGYDAMYDTPAQYGYFQQQGQSNSSLIQTGISQPHQQTFTSSEAPRPMWFPNQSGSFSVPASTSDFSWSSQQQQSSQSINISANDSPEIEPESLELDMENNNNNQAQDHPSAFQHSQFKQQQLNAHALFQQQHVQQQQRHMEQQALQQQQQQMQMLQQQQKQLHRTSIQHQHQQTFYIPQMQDDDDDEPEFEHVSSANIK